MRKFVLVFTLAAAPFLAGCVNSSLTVSETGMVTATVEGTSFGDFKTTVKNMTDAIAAACGTSMPDPGGVAPEALSAVDLTGADVAVKHALASILEHINSHSSQLQQLRGTLDGWLPSHSFTWNGKCPD